MFLGAPLHSCHALLPLNCSILHIRRVDTHIELSRHCRDIAAEEKKDLDGMLLVPFPCLLILTAGPQFH